MADSVLNTSKIENLLQNLEKEFPWKTQTFRDGQKETVTEILEAFQTGHKYVCAEVETGGGKSLISYLVAKGFEKTILTTPQILLQEQFVNSFSHLNEEYSVAMCCAATNYQCVNIPDESCGIGVCRRGGNDDNESLKDDCPFHNQKNAALDARVAVLNLPYILQEYNCLDGSTQIKLLNGTSRRIDSFENGEKFWVYSTTNTGKIVPGKATALGQTKTTKNLIEILLDNGEKIRCTPEHLFLLRDGSYLEAKNLSVGASLMPLYTNHSVVEIKFITTENSQPVYDIHVEEFNNFALSSGIFVHNCGVPGSNRFSTGDYHGKNKPELLIIDEAHSLEFDVRSFLTLRINQAVIDKYKIPDELPDLKFRNAKVDLTSIRNWCSRAIMYLNEEMASMKNRYETLNSKSVRELTKTDLTFIKYYNDVHSYEKAIGRFINDIAIHPNNWIYNTEDNGTIELRPVELFDLATRYLFSLAPKILFLSATILDERQFAYSIGLSKLKFIRMPRTIGFAKHEIRYVPIGKFNSKNIVASIPVLADAVALVMEHHPNEKGIVHLPSFMVGDGIMAIIKEKYPDTAKRILYHHSKNRMEQLKAHLDTEENTFLMSPSFYEGIDLKGDLSRVQIFCKVPYLNLGDRIVKIKFDKNKQWYTWRTMMKLTQGLGRSVRGPEDYATSYFLDENLETFYRFAHHYFELIGFPDLEKITIR